MLPSGCVLSLAGRLAGRMALRDSRAVPVMDKPERGETCSA